MDALWERLYYRLQGLLVFVQRKLLVKQLGLRGDVNYRLDLIRTLHPIKGRVPFSNAFVDVGANKGEFSQIFEHLYHPSVTICIEPNAQLNNFILSNNKTKAPIIINKAISDKEGRQEFYFHPDSQMSSLFSSDKNLMKRDFGTNDPEGIVMNIIPVTTLDAVFQQFSNELSGKTIFLKIDTQGNELEVIKGGNKAMSEIQYCLLEYMFQSPYLKQYAFEEIISLMSTHGFSCLGPMHVSYRGTGEVGAVLFLFGKSRE